MATPLGNSVPLTGTSIDGLLQGNKWSSTNLTYSLWTGAYEWSAAGKQLFRLALDTFEHYTNLKFNYIETYGQPNLTTDIEAMLSGSALQEDMGPGVIGMAVFPSYAWGDSILNYIGLSRSVFPNIEGMIFYDNEHSAYILGGQPSGAGYATVLHEIGHALGLKHPHDNGGAAFPTLASLGLAAADNEMFTIMSYKDAPGSTIARGHPVTPMVLDVAALQHLYGANMSADLGDTVHTFVNGLNATLWDAGGIDTLNYSQLNAGAFIGLQQGQYSYTYNDSTYSAIARNCNIENAWGTVYADEIHGNYLDNFLFGNSGNDLLIGGGGNDRIQTGLGSDITVFMRGNGYDTALDWQRGDILTIERTAFVKNFADVVARSVADENGSFINLGEDSGITLAGVNVFQMQASDFYFYG